MIDLRTHALFRAHVPRDSRRVAELAKEDSRKLTRIEPEVVGDLVDMSMIVRVPERAVGRCKPLVPDLPGNSAVWFEHAIKLRTRNTQRSTNRIGRKRARMKVLMNVALRAFEKRCSHS